VLQENFRNPSAQGQGLRAQVQLKPPLPTTKEEFMFKHLIIGAALVFAGASATAEIREERQVVVGLSDLNLASLEGQQALDGRLGGGGRKRCRGTHNDGRLRRAAQQVCGGHPGSGLEEYLNFNDCRFRALRGARAKAKVEIAKAQRRERLALAR
jgi:hypothetical protein